VANHSSSLNYQQSTTDIRFTASPSVFAFQLSTAEYDNLRSQIVTSSLHGGRRRPPYAFTEQGVAMLSSVLRSPRAVEGGRQYARGLRDYISIYDIQRGVADKATLPIYYESRAAKLRLNQSELPKIDEEFEAITAGEELTKEERAGHANSSRSRIFKALR
jgi:hypothetical protein